MKRRTATAKAKRELHSHCWQLFRESGGDPTVFRRLANQPEHAAKRAAAGLEPSLEKALRDRAEQDD